MTTLLRRVGDWHRPLMYLAGLMAVTGVVAVVGLIVDDRTLAGAPVWLKPLKFAISIGIYTVTWAWMMSLQQRPRRWMRRAATTVAVLLIMEMIVIVGQAARAEPSHFNNTSLPELILFQLMGASIATVWALNIAQGVVLLRERLAERPVAWAIRLGVLIALCGMAVAFFMVFPTTDQASAFAHGTTPTAIGAHTVGAADGGPGLPIVGWSTTGGDLRAPHFVGIHAMQFLPLLAMALGAAARRWPRLRTESVRTRLIAAAAVGYGGLFLVTTWQAFRSQPVIAPDSWTLGAYGLVATTTAIVVLSALTAPKLATTTKPAEAST